MMSKLNIAGPAHDSVDGAERERIRRALVDLIAEQGYARVTLEAVLERAGVGAEAFHRHFADLDRCFAEVWERMTQHFVDRALAAYTQAGGWREGMRAQAWEYCRFLQEDHVRARICMVELAFAGELVQAKRDVFMDAYVELFHLGRREGGNASKVPREKAEAVVGAIWERVASTVKAGHFEALPRQVPQLMYLTVLTYLGPEAAAEELKRGHRDIARYEREELAPPLAARSAVSEAPAPED